MDDFVIVPELKDKAILPCLIQHCFECLETSGLEIREDFKMSIGNYLGKEFGELDSFTQQMVARKLDADMVPILSAANLDDLREMTLAVCYAVMKFVDESRLMDPTAPAVLTALAIADEAENYEGWGKVSRARKKAGKVFDEILRRGYLGLIITNPNTVH